MRAAVVDASVWVSRFVGRDINYLASCRWLEGHLERGGIIVAPAILLSEVAGPIAMQTGTPVIAHAACHDLLRLEGFRHLPVDGRLGRSAAELAAELLLRSADAVYVATALNSSLPLISWDDQQRVRGSAAVTVLVPPGNYPDFRSLSDQRVSENSLVPLHVPFPLIVVSSWAFFASQVGRIHALIGKMR